MPVIHLETAILAPRERVFDLARSIDAHQATAEHTEERAIAGVTSGLLGLGEDVTWEARHFGMKQRLRVKMTKCERPRYFQDCMLEGAFRRMTHDHSFELNQAGTLMTDRLEFCSPLGVVGRFTDWALLESYLRGFLTRRNAVLKRMAESDEWKKYLERPG